MTAMELAREALPSWTAERLFARFACRNIKIGGQVVADPKALVPKGAAFEMDDAPRYVGRGGLKLERALEAFGLDFAGKVALDAGASTGGFTDCLLRHGAKAVHSVDVGYNQLDWSLRRDSRVIVHERQNIMALESLSPQPWAAVADLSFRSIAGAAAHILSLTSARILVALVKPQFELGRSFRRGAAESRERDFHGVVNDRGLLRSTMASVARSLRLGGTGIADLALSPIRGRKGNIEFLALIRPGAGLPEERFEALLDRLLEDSQDLPLDQDSRRGEAGDDASEGERYLPGGELGPGRVGEEPPAQIDEGAALADGEP